MSEFDRILDEAAKRPEPTPEEWIQQGICPECIHDMVPCLDGQFCPECGFFTETKRR